MLNKVAMSTPTLSLCMIVRDEAAMLPKFLSHAQGLWDELCVVDTGSQDDTCSILRDAGARVYHQAWQDDFAAARNASLEHAHGDWVLILDPDERVTPEFVHSARETLLEPGLGAATVPLRNRLDHGNYTLTYLLRMWRNDPSIHFEHAIHEDAVPSVLQALERSGQQLGRLSGWVDHLGYSRGVATARDKRNRDVRILQRCVEADPNDVYSWFKILEQARFWRDVLLLEQHTPAALQALSRMPAVSLRRAHYVGEMLTLLAEGLHAQAPAAALHFMEPWEKGIAPSAAYFLRRGELRELLGHFEPAAQDFRRCLMLRPVTPNLQLAGTRPLLGLARLAIARNQMADALECIQVALQENPRDPEALLSLMMLSRQLGGMAAVNSMTDAYLSTYGDCAELRAALGESALRGGDAHTAVRELELAVAQRGGAYDTLLAEARAQART